MGMLTGAGAVDTGAALRAAAICSCDSPVNFLLQQWKRNRSGERAGYLETYGPSGRTPMLYSIEACRLCSPRITRLLVDAGADTTTAVRLKDESDLVFFHGTPLAFTNFGIREKKTEGEDATEEQFSLQPGGYPAIADEGGGCSCGLLAVGKQRSLFYSSCYRGCGQGQGDSDPADIDVADLEAKGSKTQGALGGPVQALGEALLTRIVSRGVSCGVSPTFLRYHIGYWLGTAVEKVAEQSLWAYIGR